MENVLPIILYKLNGEEFGTHNIITKSPTIYFYSYQNFDVKIKSGNGLLYSVLQKVNPEGENYLETKSGQEFIGKQNFGYTLFIPENKTSIQVEVTSIDGFKDVYQFTLELINQETEETEHYNDLIINNYLPTLKELEPALLPNTEKAELLKRMLLDFKDIMRVKGTKASIEKFFYFIGFLPEQLKINEEYKKNGESNNTNYWGFQNITVNPNKLVDTKTGNYHVLFNNWDDGEQDGKQTLNDKNLPYRPYATEDFDALFESLKYAIPLANKYFTLVEQEITFFGICFSSNIPMFPSITSVLNQIFVNDVYDFRKDLHIDLSYYDLTYKKDKLRTFLVKNCFQSNKDAYRSEVKYVVKTDVEQYNGELYFVEREISDDEPYNEDLPTYRRSFGALLHLNIKSPKTYIRVIIYNKINEISRIEYNKQWCEDEIEIQFVTEKSDEYKIIIEITDMYNNMERYFYDYIISDNIARINIDVFNSLLMIDKNFDDNHIDLDVDSPTITTKPLATSRNYVLPMDVIPEDLVDYWKVVPSGQLRWLTQASQGKYTISSMVFEEKKNSKNPQYIIPSINTNFKISELTDTIPLELTEQWLEILAIPVTESLKINLYDADTCEYKLVDIDKLNQYDPTFDRLFVRTMNVIIQETNETKKYYFICSTETGIQMNKKSFDLQISDGISVYDLMGKENNFFVSKQRIPVNFDFPLFPVIGDEFVYCSKDCYRKPINNGIYPIIKSMFPRMINILSDEFDEMSILKLGDVILGRINQDYIVNESNTTWNVFNAFTNELMYTTTDYMLKYRIDDNTCYTITCDFDIDAKHHQIIKTGIFTSFKVQHYE